MFLVRRVSDPNRLTRCLVGRARSAFVDWSRYVGPIIPNMANMSILGTGLHTFVLYLGPFIAQVTLAATECKSTDIETYGPNRYVTAQHSIINYSSIYS